MPELIVQFSSPGSSDVTDAAGALAEIAIEDHVFDGGRDRITAGFGDPDSDYVYTVDIIRGILLRPSLTAEPQLPVLSDVQVRVLNDDVVASAGLRPDEPIGIEYARWPETRDRLRSPTYRPEIPMGGVDPAIPMGYGMPSERATLPPDPRSEWEEWLGSQGRR